MKRKIIQITTTAAATEEDGVTEYLYALDSDGTIWWWRPGSGSHTAGWEALTAPWDAPRTKKEPLA